jgi:CRP-like cAMP-binding protein
MSVNSEPIGPASWIGLSPLDRRGWLSEQAADFRAAVMAAGRWRLYPAGRFLYQSGDASDGLYGLASGALELTFPLVADEPVTIHRAEIGFWIGDSAEFSETPRIVGVMAATESRVLHVPGAAMRRILERQPEHWRALYRLSALNVETAVRLLSEALALTVRARVARRLLVLADQRRDVPITQAELATLVGVTRATLQRCLASLAAEGAVKRRYGAVSVIDPTRLERFVDEQ